MIHNLRDFLRLLDAAYKRNPVGFTPQEFHSIRTLSNFSLLFLEQVQRYLSGDPKPYARLSARAMAQERVRPQASQAMGNVHDHLLKGPRLRTQEWLEEQSLFPKEEESQKKLKTYLYDKQKELLNWVRESVLTSEDKAVLRAYIPFFFYKYSGRHEGALNLFRAMAWADQVLERQSDDRSAKKHNLLGGLLEAAKAYEGESEKFYTPHDYTCMRGLDERVLDVMTGVRLSLEPPVALEHESPQKRYIAASIDPFVTRDATGPKPTDLFYALYVHAKYPEGFTIESQPAIQIQLHPKDSKKYTKALAAYEQKIQADIEQYRSAPSEGAKAALKSPLKPYFMELEDSIAFLEKNSLREAISQKFASLYEQYQGQIFAGYEREGDTLETVRSRLPIPLSLKSLVEPTPYCVSTTLKSQGPELQNSEEILQAMSAFSGLEEDFLESLCRLSGGLEESLLGVLEAQRERGDGVSQALFTREGLQDQLQPALQEMDHLYSQLSFSDLGHTARRASFQDWLRGKMSRKIGSIQFPYGNFIASEAQYLRIWESITDEGLERLLSPAVEQGKTAFVRKILEKHPNWISPRELASYAKPREFFNNNTQNVTLFHQAIYYDHKDIAEFLIQKGGIDFSNIPDIDGCPILHWAAQHGRKNIAKLLIEKSGENLWKIKDNMGNTALHWAVRSGNKDMVELLINQGGIELFCIKDTSGKMALDYTWNIKSKNLESIKIVELLTNMACLSIEQGAVFNKSTYPIKILSHNYLYNPTWRNYGLVIYALLQTQKRNLWGCFNDLRDLRTRRIALEKSIVQAMENPDSEDFKKLPNFIVKQVAIQKNIRLPEEDLNQTDSDSNSNNLSSKQTSGSLFSSSSSSGHCTRESPTPTPIKKGT